MEILNFGGSDRESFNEGLQCFLSDLSRRFPQYMHQPKRLEEIIKQFKYTQFCVVIEPEYVDKQYRDSYYVYFAQKYREIPRNCLRLSFFEGSLCLDDFQAGRERLSESFVGLVVLRPLHLGAIGKTLIDPKKINTEAQLQTCSFQSCIAGVKVNYSAFPFSSQDSETMTCAQTSLFNLISYYGRKYPEYRVLMPTEILRSIENNHYERVLPADGLQNEYIAKVLLGAHLHPRLYNETDSFKDILHIYVESGIPFILGVPYHVVNCIGCMPIDRTQSKEALCEHAKQDVYQDSENGKMVEGAWLLSTADLTEKYIVMDDNRPPYQATSIEEITQLYYKDSVLLREKDPTPFTKEHTGEEKLIRDNDSLIVPLYRRVYIDAPKAKDVFFSEFFQNEVFLDRVRDAYSDPTWGTCKGNPIVWRIYLTTSKKYRDFKLTSILPKAKENGELTEVQEWTAGEREEIADYYMKNVFPHFIWVMEMGSISSFKSHHERVEVLLDASSSPNSESRSILGVSYLNHALFFPLMTDARVTEELRLLAVDELCKHSKEELRALTKREGLNQSEELLQQLTEKQLRELLLERCTPEKLLGIDVSKKYLTAAFSELYNESCSFPGECFEFNNLEG